MRWRLSIVLACAAIVSACGSPEARGTAARPASDFVNSIGVNVHMSYSDTPYDDVRRVRRALSQLGVRHVRDGLVLRRPDQHRALRALRRAGIRSNLILGDPSGRFGSGSLREQLTTLRRSLHGIVSSVEGPNEYDASDDPEWASRLRDYQAGLARGLRRERRLRDIPLVGPSFIDRGSFGEVGRLDALDFGNIHPYPGGLPPEENVGEQLGLAREVAGSRPVFATETGYHNATRSEAEDFQPGVPEHAAAVYYPRLYLEYFRRGIARTFAYELLDEGTDRERNEPEDSFGLVRTDFTRKPAFRSLRNLITVLADRGKGPGGTGRLRYSLVNDAGVKSLLLQKANGRFYLALWRADTAVWSVDAEQRVATRRRRVEVRLGSAIRRVAAYRPVRSRRARWTRRRTSTLRLDLRADPLVLELTPAK